MKYSLSTREIPRPEHKGFFEGSGYISHYNILNNGILRSNSWDIRSNITLCLQEFPRALPTGTLSGKGIYLTVYPLSCPNTDTVYHLKKVLYWKFTLSILPSELIVFPSKHTSNIHPRECIVKYTPSMMVIRERLISTLHC